MANKATQPEQIGANETSQNELKSKSGGTAEDAAQTSPKARPGKRPKAAELSGGGEVPSTGIITITSVESAETTFDVPTARVLFASPVEGQRVARLALALDAVGSSILPLLVADSDAECTDLDAEFDLTQALTQAAFFPTIKTFTFGGTALSMIGLATGQLEQTNSADGGTGLSSEFLSALAARHYLDPAVVQSLREVCSSTELLQLLSRRRLGWLFDEICRLACLEVRKRFRAPAALEAIAFGTSGAVLGRAMIEPGTFLL